MSNQKIASVTVKRGDQNYSLITIWSGKYQGTYSISLDKGSEKYPPINFLEALKAFAARDCFVNLRIESQAEKRSAKREDPGPGGWDGYGDGRHDGDPDIPF